MFFMPEYSSMVSAAVKKKHWPKETWGTKGLIQLICLTYLSSREVKARTQGRNWRQEWSRDHEQSCFLYNPGLSAQVWYLLLTSLALPLQLQTKKNVPQPCSQAYFMWATEVHSSQITSLFPIFPLSDSGYMALCWVLDAIWWCVLGKVINIDLFTFFTQLSTLTS